MSYFLPLAVAVLEMSFGVTKAIVTLLEAPNIQLVKREGSYTTAILAVANLSSCSVFFCTCLLYTQHSNQCVHEMVKGFS